MKVTAHKSDNNLPEKLDFDLFFSSTWTSFLIFPQNVFFLLFVFVFFNVEPQQFTFFQ